MYYLNFVKLSLLPLLPHLYHHDRGDQCMLLLEKSGFQKLGGEISGLMGVTGEADTTG